MLEEPTVMESQKDNQGVRSMSGRVEYGKEWEVGFKEKYELELELEVHLWKEGKYAIS